MLLTGDNTPLFDIEFGKPGITFKGVIDIGHIETIRPWQCKLIDAAATDNHDFALCGGYIQGLLEGISCHHALRLKIRRTGQHDIGPARQWPADRLIGFTPMIMGLPMVTCLKCARSAGKCQGSWFLLPIRRLRSIAAIIETSIYHITPSVIIRTNIFFTAETRRRRVKFIMVFIDISISLRLRASAVNTCIYLLTKQRRWP